MVEVIETKEKTWTPVEVEKLAEDTARKYGIPVYSFVETMRCESKDFTVIHGQSEIPVPDGPNGYENSWGVAQFWLEQPMSTPEGGLVTKEIATDPKQALEIAAWHFSQGRASQWSCYKKLQANAR